MSQPKVIVIGDLLYDLLAQVEDVAFGTDTFAAIHTAAGGSGANAAVWLARLGVETHFVGRVGDDVFGRSLAEELRKEGVVAHLARDPALATGKVFVLVDGAGERTMITDRGAGENLRPSDLPADLFRTGTHLHLSGYLFTGGTRRETAIEALHLARENEMSVCVDPSSVPLLKTVEARRFLEWTAGTGLCFPNLHEGALLAGCAGDPDAVATALTRHYPEVVLKLGPAGALYAAANGDRIHIPATSEQALDTTGAGDALSAGFLAVRLGGSNPENALRQGLELAGRTIGRMGGRAEA